MERKIANIDEFQVDENEVPMLPAGLREEGNLYVLPDGRYLPCGLYRTADGDSLIYEPVSYTHLDVYKRQMQNRACHDGFFCTQRATPQLSSAQHRVGTYRF